MAAASLGDGRLSYDTVLTLDGVRYTASALWPASTRGGEAGRGGNQRRGLGRHIGVIRGPRAAAPSGLAVGLLVVAVAACGSGGSGSDGSRGGAPDREWVGQVLEGEPGADQPTQLAVDGEDVVVAIVSDDGVMTGFATDDQGHFRAGERTASGHRYLSLGGVTRFGDGWVALGSGGLVDDELLFEVRAFHSADGRTWSEVDATGFDGPVDVTGLATVDSGLVAVGTLRTADEPAWGGFRPVAWRSARMASAGRRSPCRPTAGPRGRRRQW